MNLQPVDIGDDNQKHLEHYREDSDATPTEGERLLSECEW